MYAFLRGFLKKKTLAKQLVFSPFFSVISFPAVPFGKGEPNNHPNKLQTMESNFLEKGKNEIKFEESSLRNNPFLSALLSALTSNCGRAF